MVYRSTLCHDIRKGYLLQAGKFVNMWNAIEEDMVNYIKSLGSSDEQLQLNILKKRYFNNEYGENKNFQQVAIRNKAFDALYVAKSELLDKSLMTNTALEFYKRRNNNENF